MSSVRLEDSYRLSPLQEGMLYHRTLAWESGVEIFHIVGSLPEELEPRAFHRAWQRVVDRYAIFRTRFRWRGLEEPLQEVQSHATLPWHEEDWRGLAPEEQAKRREGFLQADRERGFDLEKAPLIRAALLRLGEESWEFVWTMYHGVVDGRSVRAVLIEVFESYEALRRGEEPVSAPVEPFRGYIDWFEARDMAASQGYWRHLLEGFEAPTPLAATKVARRLEAAREAHSDREVHLAEPVTAVLEKLCRERGFTLNTLLQGAWALLLSRYNGSDDVLFGCVKSNRASVPEGRKIIGPLINTLVLRVRISPRMSTVSWLEEIRAQWLSHRDHESTPLARIQQWSEVEPEKRLFESVVLFETFRWSDLLESLGHAWAKRRVRICRQPDYPLILYGFKGRRLTFNFIYDRRVFDATTIARMLGQLETVLEAVAADPQCWVDQIDVLRPAERHQLLVEWNDTEAGSPARPVHRLFELQVERTPGHVAVCRGERRLSYRELNARANRLARALIARGGRRARVGLLLGRSIETVVGVLGVLKAGGAYLPLDPGGPEARNALILEDAHPEILLLAESSAPSSFQGEEVVVESAVASITQSGNPDLEVHAADTAYILYTSGSTGRPKGVVVSHGALANYLGWARARYDDRREGANFPVFTSLSFDLTVTSLFVPLLCGGTAVVYPEAETGGAPAVAEVMREGAGEVLKGTPSHLGLVEAAFPVTGTVAGLPSRWRKIILGGEDLKCALAWRLHELLPGAEIVNEYGPTETTVACTLHRYDPARDVTGSVPIGRPIRNTRIHVLDHHLRPLPVGVAGELYVGGRGVARGYLNQPALTAERFVPHPWDAGATLYRTGDRARLRGDGCLEFLGRRDHQVKVRGYRVELAEVEAELSSHPAVREAVVDVLGSRRTRPDAASRYCVRCGLSSEYPGTRFDAGGLCNVCTSFETYKDKVADYFHTMDDLRRLFARVKADRRGRYDCLALLSGGKDSTYVLYQLREMGLEVLAFTLDNGYISEGAKTNIRKVVEDLGVDHVFGTTPFMNAIFADSLRRFSNVCNGCFKTIYTLAVRLAREKGIRHIVTGLSRGQLFETRLAELYRAGISTVGEIDRAVLRARQVYHRLDDAVSRHLDVGVFDDERIFEEIEFIDFYRYCDVELEEVMSFLERRAPWIRPSDTGRSTNCLINDAGIWVHKKERSFHNYALPYSWDVRLGHKTREAALEELDDELDVDSVRRMLDEVGYRGEEENSGGSARLIAYYASDEELDDERLRGDLGRGLPEYMIPSSFVRLAELPRGASGKVDRKALARAEEERAGESSPARPRTATQEILARIWCDILRISEVGVDQSFFDLGGHSVLAVQLHARLDDAFGVGLSLHELFETPTVAGLAQRLDALFQKDQGAVLEEVRESG